MKIIKETALRNFEFWGPAEDNTQELSDAELDSLESYLEETYPDGIDAVDLNDLMAYDFEWVCEVVNHELDKDLDEINDDDDFDEDEFDDLIEISEETDDEIKTF